MDRDHLLLPEGSVLLHIGPYKTGSSAIQASLHHSREQLAAHGVRYAGGGIRAMRAGWGLIGSTPRGRQPATEADWQALVEETREAAESRVAISTEDFGRVGPAHIERIVEDLGRDRLHVLCVVRRLDRLLPSQWQQRAQSYRTTTYDDYLRVVLAEQSEHADHRAFWASHEVDGQVARWVAEVGEDRFTLLVADETDHDLLPRTVERMLGLPEGLLEPEPQRNASLSLNAIELLRRVNLTFADRGWSDEVYHQLVRNGMVRQMKQAGRSPLDERIPRLPTWAVDRVRELSDQQATAVERMGVRVVGDPASLRTVDSVTDTEHPGQVDAIALESVVAAVSGVVEGMMALERHDDRRNRRRLRRAQRGQAVSDGVADLSRRELVAALRGRVGLRLRRAVPGR